MNFKNLLVEERYPGIFTVHWFGGGSTLDFFKKNGEWYGQSFIYKKYSTKITDERYITILNQFTRKNKLKKLLK